MSRLRHPQPGGAFFARLYVDGGNVTGQKLNEPFNMLHQAYVIYRERKSGRQGQERQARGQGRAYHRTHGALALAEEWEAQDEQIELAAWLEDSQAANSAGDRTATTWENFSQELALALAGQGWSNDVLVGAAGLEPATARV